MRYYCHLSSPTTSSDTNLQLYSLIKASEAWNELANIISKVGIDDVDHFTERCSFIIATLGLSLMQLLGQNNPSPEKENMGRPHEMFSYLLHRTRTDRTKQKQLNKTFREFLKYYAIIRHFGKNKFDQNYHDLDRLTLDEVNRFRKMTIEFWNIMIDMYRQEGSFDGSLSSVSEIVHFIELP